MDRIILRSKKVEQLRVKKKEVLEPPAYRKLG